MPKTGRSLFIDGQVFQSAAWDRGMGKYSLEFIKALTSNKDLPYKNIYLLFTKNRPLEDAVTSTIKKFAPSIRQIRLDLQVPVDPSRFELVKMQTANEFTVSNFVSAHSSDNNADYIVLSLFIDQVCSVFPDNARKILLFYDLIPFQYCERYNQLTSYKYYLGRFRTLFQADLIYTISQSIADDVALNLGIPQSKLVNIDGAPIKRNHHAPTKPDMDVPARYVLMPSGDEIRKNNTRAVQGFEEYVRQHKDAELRLIITSHFEEKTKTELMGLSRNLIFAGNVKESELVWLYTNAELVLFVSEYEGLGLPVLEAVEANKPMVCSNLSVFNEVSDKAFYFANQFDISSISDALGDALVGKEYTQKHKEYPSIMEHYTWPNTAKKAINALLTTNKDQVNGPSKKLKIAIFTPSPSGYSEIGRRVAQLHPTMQEYFDIDYYVEAGLSHQNFPRPDYLSHIANVYSAHEFTNETYKNYSAVLYNVGNSEFHLDTIKNALFLPGYVVFHDTHLTNVFEEVLVPHHYISKDRSEAEHQLDLLMKNEKSSYITSLANRQRGIIVHSEYGKEVVKKVLLDKIPIHKLNLPTAVPKIKPHRLNSEDICIGLAGIIHPAKGLDIIEAIALSDKFISTKIHIFGLPLVGNDILQQLDAYPNVSIDTNLTDFEFQNMLREVDILINFRKDYRGEASAATIDAMRYGAVPIVKDIGWYNELPSDSVVKATTVDEVLAQLEELVLDSSERHQMGDRGRDKIRQDFSYQLYAENIYQALIGTTAENTNEKFAILIKQGLSKKTLQQYIAG